MGSVPNQWVYFVFSTFTPLCIKSLRKTSGKYTKKKKNGSKRELGPIGRDRKDVGRGDNSQDFDAGSNGRGVLLGIPGCPVHPPAHPTPAPIGGGLGRIALYGLAPGQHLKTKHIA